MTWVAVPVSPDEVTAESLYDLGRKHRLVPENTPLAMGHYQSMVGACAVIRVKDEETDTVVAHLIVSDIVDGESATVDLILVSKLFSPVDKNGNRNAEPFMEKISFALTPVFEKLIEGRGLRRLTSVVPKTYSRAFKALRECGFKKEGVMRNAVKFRGKDAEDLVIMGMLAVKE
jgi:hypothetical protein